MARRLRARYVGTCPRCGRPIEPGDWITQDAKRWAHEDCDQAARFATYCAEYEATAQAIMAADPSLSWDEVEARMAAVEEAAQRLDVDELIAGLLA
jgi:hypothetical protein